jgi:hypothetical protein
MTIKDFLRSSMFKKILIGLGVVIVICLVFQAGIFIGHRRAGFSYNWGEKYDRTFGRRERGFMPFNRMMPLPLGRDFTNSNGTIGKIISVNLPTLVIEDQDKVEKIVLIKEDTVIRSLRDAVRPADLKVNDSVVIVGSPNDKAQIEAKLIRLMPEPPPALPNP